MRIPTVLRTSAAVLVVVGCRGADITMPTPVGTASRPLLLGADISSLARIEQSGATFRDSGRTGDAVDILRRHGSNIFRLRLFVNPDGDDVEVNDLPYTIALARRIKSAGARLLLDLHYSDTWGDPGHQAMPAAWATLDYAALTGQVERYTDSVVTQLRNAGATPDLVQLGNEVDAGMLWPLGRVHGDSDSTASWGRFTGLLQAGIRGVRDAVTPGDSVRIVLHFSQGGDAGATDWFFDHIAAADVPYDVIGVSYYPWWHGSVTALRANLHSAASRYNHDVMVVETSYPWRSGGWESMASDVSAMTWAVSPSGQAAFVHDVTAAVASVPDHRGLGVVWWYPEAVAVPDLFIWGGGSLAWFDDAGNVLAAATLATP